MKKALTPTQGTAAVSEPWRAALRTFDADLQRRGAAERTRKAYGTDAAELAAWATANGLDPAPGRLQGPAPLGRAAVASAAPPRGRWRASSRRSAASSAACSSTARSRRNPADLLPAPKLPQTPPKTLKPEDVAAPAGEDPGLDAARAARPRAVRARLLERPAGRGARRSRRHAASTSTQNRSASRARVPRPASCPPVSRRCAAIAAYLERARPALSGADPEPALFLSKSGRRLSTSRRPAPPARVGAARRHADRRAPARPAAFLRHPSARGRRGPARDPGDAGSREYLDDPGLHSGRVRPAAGGVCEEPPAGVKRGRSGDQRQSDRAEGAVAPLQDRRLRQGPRTARRRLLTTREVRRRPHVVRACRRTSKRPT